MLYFNINWNTDAGNEMQLVALSADLHNGNITRPITFENSKRNANVRYL